MESLIIMHEFDVFYAISGRGEQKKHIRPLLCSSESFQVLPFFGGCLQPLRKVCFVFMLVILLVVRDCQPKSLTSLSQQLPGNLLMTFCGWLSDPFKGCWWRPTFGDEKVTLLESPGGSYVMFFCWKPRHFSIVLSSDRPQSKMETMIFWPKVPGDGDEVSRGKISQDMNPIDEQLGHPMGQALYYWPTFLQERINS